MKVSILNTLGKRKEELTTVTPGVVKMYVCGPTVQDLVHLGHGRTFVAFDGVVRYLKMAGYDVIRVQNITDIDDKIISKASQEGRSWEDVADHYSREYLEAMRSLKVGIDMHPKVTKHIGEIVDFVSRLIDKGNAYVAPSGSVYFDVTTYPAYGELSNTKMEEWDQGEEFLKEKRHPYDFALWKSAKPGEPNWDSPWGKGRPGWHIECSTMSSRYLGGKFDIHGGGADLVFPHHENERAQSEALLGSGWVRYWMHASFVTVRKEKMAKSKGNFISIKDALSKWSPSVLRYWFLSTHYRSEVDFSEEALQEASNALNRLKDALAVARSVVRESKGFRASDADVEIQRKIVRLHAEFHERMSDDFDTPGALASIHRVAGVVFSELQGRDNLLGGMLAVNAFREFNQVFGVMDEEFWEGARTAEVIDAVLKVRNVLRERKMFDLSDELRSALAKAGIKVLDGKEGSTWRFE
ncbi:cysteine--tRNA ligase [Sulfodiicoccus acidiphilus]|nr:cysteine--tRNA ligase [Sulfodiicoccus acidiphilus]